jgi:uroporphyrinogen-III synthase
MCSLIERLGGVPLSAPSMREIPIADNPDAVRCIQRALAGQYAMTILMTGVGTEALFEVARSQNLYEQYLEALRNSVVVIRGPKPAAVLNKAGLRYDLKAPEPNTWRELLDALDEAAGSDPQRFGLQGRTVAVQEYGLPNSRFYDELQQRGAFIERVPVYRWALPLDLNPLQQAIRSIVAGTVQIVLFTSANQITNVLQVARDMSAFDELRVSLQSVLVASIGPTCTEALQEAGPYVACEASPPKMGPLVRAALESWNLRESHKSAP